MTFTVVDGQTYFAQLKKLLPAAQRRVVLAAMVVMRGPKMDELLEPLLKLANRGVHVHVLLDRFTTSLATRPNDLDIAEFKKLGKATYELFDKLKAAGGRVSVVGEHELNPYAGRYHAKITVVDDDVYSFGGVNLRDDAFESIDYMLHTTDKTLADTLEQLVARNAHDDPRRDLQIQLTPNDTLLFDAGQKRESIIYTRACQLAKEARTVTYVSQMAPTGKLAKALRATKTIYFANRPSQTGFRVDTLGQWFDQHTVGLENHYEGREFLHAKFILFELYGGKKVLLSGSHNFSWRGVAFGTREIALESTGPGLWQQLHEMVYRVATAE